MYIVAPGEKISVSLHDLGFGIADHTGKLVSSIGLDTGFGFENVKIYEGELGQRLAWILSGDVVTGGILKVVALNFETLGEVMGDVPHGDEIRLNTVPLIFVKRS